MKHVSVSLVGILFALSAAAQTPPNNNNNGQNSNPYSRALPLPPPKTIQGSFPSLDSAVQRFVTHGYPGSTATNPSQLLVQFIDGYTSWSGLPDAQKHLILKYFELSDTDVLAAVKRAQQAGIGNITIILDINQAAVGTNFPSATEDSTDFEHIQFKNNGDGRGLKWLQDNGFVWRMEQGHDVILSGVLLTNPSKKGQETDLMHDKVAMGVGYPYSLNGSYNPSQPPEGLSKDGQSWGGRYNSVNRILDPVITKVDVDHALLEIQEYDKRTGKGVQWDGPWRVTYPDGSFYETAFTDKVYNPNDRITKMLLDAADPKNKITVKEIVFSEFVVTETPEIQALRKLLQAQKDFPLFGVFDESFISLYDYGEAGVMEGYVIQRPHGGPVFPFSRPSLLNSQGQPRAELYGYQRLLDDVSTVHLNDPVGDIHLWHDKTMVIKTTETDAQSGNPVNWTYVFTRSFNDSNHFQDLESQAMMRFHSESPVAQQIEAGIKNVAHAETQFALDLDKAIVRDWLGKFTEHSLYDIDPNTQVPSVISALKNKDYKTFANIISQIASSPTRGDHQPNVSDIQAHTQKLVDFLNWYQGELKNAGSGKTEGASSLSAMTEEHAVNIGVALATGNVYGMRAALDQIYYNPSRTITQTQAMEQRAWSVGLKMPGNLPAAKDNYSFSKANPSKSDSSSDNRDQKSQQSQSQKGSFSDCRGPLEAI